MPTGILNQNSVELDPGESMSLQEIINQDANWVQVWESNTGGSSGYISDNGQKVGQSKWLHLDSDIQINAGQSSGSENIWVKTWNSDDGTSQWDSFELITGGSNSNSIEIATTESASFTDLVGDAPWAQVWQSDLSSNSAAVTRNGEEVGQSEWFPVK